MADDLDWQGERPNAATAPALGLSNKAVFDCEPEETQKFARHLLMHNDTSLRNRRRNKRHCTPQCRDCQLFGIIAAAIRGGTA